MMDNISYAELQQKLATLKAMDLAKTEYAVVSSFINTQIPMPLLVTQMHSGNFIERIRINHSDEVFTTKSELSYRRDLANIRSFGRANIPGQSMFYGGVISSAITSPRIVALAETEELLRGKDKGSKDKDLVMTVSKWQIIKDMKLIEMVFRKQEVLKTPEIKKARDWHIKNMRLHMPKNDVDKMVSILEFYCEEFSKAEINSGNDYKISAAYCENALKHSGLQGIIYPSIRTDFEGSNVALLPETVNECLQFDEALIIHVQIKGTKVFLENLYRTGSVDKDEEVLNWFRMDPVSQEIKDKFFNNNLF